MIKYLLLDLFKGKTTRKQVPVVIILKIKLNSSLLFLQGRLILPEATAGLRQVQSQPVPPATC